MRWIIRKACISVITHSDSSGSGSGGEFYTLTLHKIILSSLLSQGVWAHHEKVVIIDNQFACIGGLDLCFGRWDTQNHPLADIHPTDFRKTLFPGQDYNNARVKDFKDVSNHVSNELNGLETARMPWHDVRPLQICHSVMVTMLYRFIRHSRVQSYSIYHSTSPRDGMRSRREQDEKV